MSDQLNTQGNRSPVSIEYGARWAPKILNILENNNFFILAGIEYQNIHATVWLLLCLCHFLLAHSPQQGSRATMLLLTSPSETDTSSVPVPIVAA